MSDGAGGLLLTFHLQLGKHFQIKAEYATQALRYEVNQYYRDGYYTIKDHISLLLLLVYLVLYWKQLIASKKTFYLVHRFL